MPKQETNMVSNEKQSNIFTETFNKLFKENKESSMLDRFSSLDAKEKILAVSTVGVIFGVLLPFVLVALPVAATGAAVALTLFFAVKAVEYGYKGLKWSAEKTWEGAKRVGEQIEKVAVRAKDSVKKGYENSVDSLKRGAHLVNKRTKEKVNDMAYSAVDALYKASGKADYSDKIKRLTQDEIEKSDEIKNDMKEIFADKGNNTELVKGILSGISSKIDLKIAEEAKLGWMEHTSKWQVQKEFINNLNEKSLRSLLTQRSLPKSGYFIDSVFSEHHSEIKEVIKEYRENHLYSSVSNMFNTAEKKANRPSLKGLIRSLPSFPSLRRKSPTKSEGDKTEEPFSSDFGVPDNTATVNPTRLRRNSLPSSLYDGPPVLTPAAPPKVPKSRSDSPDSGIDLPDPSTPTGRQSLSSGDLNRSRLKKTGLLNQLVGQPPSTKVDNNVDVQPKTTPKTVS